MLPGQEVDALDPRLVRKAHAQAASHLQLAVRVQVLDLGVVEENDAGLQLRVRIRKPREIVGAVVAGQGVGVAEEDRIAWRLRVRSPRLCASAVASSSSPGELTSLAGLQTSVATARARRIRCAPV